MRYGRLFLVLTLLLGSLTAITGSSTAQVTGSELLEAVADNSAGEDAYIVLEGVTAFPEGGGEAVFEPGTENEEAFTYAIADTETNRLVGLTRSAPLSHSVGAFVEASPQGDSAPAPAPAETPAGDASAAERGDEADSSSPPDGSTDSSAGSPPVCELVTDTSCDEFVDDTLGPVVGDPPTLGGACGGIKECDEVDEVIDEFETGDACDPDNTGQTCDGWLTEVLGGVLGAVCDPGNTGQTCSQWLTALVDDPPCSGEACDILGDPLGPWSVCDVDNTGAECPDPDDVIDLVWSIDNPLSDLECTASVSGPGISDGGGMVRGRGTFDCGEAVDTIHLTVCLHRSSGGVWVKMGCRKGYDVLFGSSSLSKRIIESCVRQQTVRYRIRARGRASDGPDEDRDVAKATAELYCPGPSSAADAASDALEFAESWSPTGD